MIRKPRNRRLELESLEGRTLLSGLSQVDSSRFRAPLASASERSVVSLAATPQVAQAKSFVKSVEVINSTSIQIRFKQPISRQLAKGLRYEIDGLQVLSSQLARNGRTATLTTTPQDGVLYTARVSMIQGSGNRARVTSQAAVAFTGKSAPRIIEIIPISETSILVTYDRPMGDLATLPQNYQLIDQAGQSVRIASAGFVGGDTSQVALQTAPQSFATYSFNVNSNVTDTSGQQVFFEGRKITGNPKGAVVSVAATSSTTVVVAYNEPMADNAIAPQHYSIKDASGKSLLVTGARFDGPLGMVVILTTAAQTGGSYQLTVSNVTDLQNDGLDIRTASFQGIAAPALVKAIPTQSTRVVLTFSGPVGDSALAASTYRIDQLNTQGIVVATLPITSASFVGGQRTVVELATASQADARYRVTTTSALTDVPGTPLPVATAEFFGIGSRPVVAAATSTGAGTLLVTYSEAMSDDALIPSSYVITSASGVPLRVLAARFVGSERRVVELITDPQGDQTYNIGSITATDLDGNLAILPAVPGINTFRGKGTPGEATEIAGPPRVVGAASLNNREMIVVFSEPMADDAIVPANYILTQVSVNPQVGAIPVTAAEFYQGNRSVVKLTTLSQNELAYRVTVVNVTDRAGNALAPKAGSDGGVTDPTSSTFPGTPPRVGTQTDTDGDGVTDNEELRGWTVTIVLANGTIVERQVTSDPTLADTDGDGIPDRIELAYRSDPRDGDTDDDELPDDEEIDDNRGFPTKQDSDDDGLTDKAEKLGWTVIVTLEDGTTVTQQVTSNPFLPDTDFDGLLDRIEQIVKVDARNPDSDGDGAPDGKEVLGGTNPTKKNPGDNVAADPQEPPRVTGAASQSNKSLLVAFSKPMDASALVPGNYIIVQTNVNPEPGVLLLADGPDADSDPDIVWANAEHTAVLLSTYPQNELTYTVTVVNMRDLSGNAIAPPTLTIGGVLINPASVNFPGTPAAGAQDTDGDGLADNIEMRGWFVTVKNADGTTTTRGVTSDPTVADTDGDGLNDAQEANLRFDPRAIDSDDDQINDFAEFNELYSNGLDQDTDDDGLDDFVEWAFFRTSPIFADTDGDQTDDGDEISGNRNALVSDLPRPEIEVGDINLQLNVQFSESNAQEKRDLETRTATTTLSASQSQSLTRQYTASVEAKIEGGYNDGWFLQGSVTAGFTYNQTEQSASEATRSYERSLSTDREVTRGFTVQRNVVGAVMQVAVNLRNVSNLAYRVKNLQVTALIQDPLDHTRMTPVATLVPDNEPEEGYTLGPLATNRGPIIFSNDTIVPSLVESLMANSSGLIFRISNYDVIDENDRNFAFISQEVVERTALLVIDFGGARSLRAQVSGEPIDENQPGDETEILRVSTSYGRVIDTNFDGQIDGDDRRATFDSVGKEVGISLFDALAAAGLTRYDEATTPMSSLTDEEILNSYSTFLDGTREKIYRIRGVANDSIIEKYWEILTPLGIDQVTDVNDLVLKTDSPVSLNFVQDLDKDGLPADVEFLLRTSDKKIDTDDDSLDDRFEALIGWTVDTPQGRYQVYSSPNRADSNFDTPKPGVDSEGDGIEDRLEYDGSDTFAAPAGWNDDNGNGLRDLFEVFQLSTADYVLDPIRRDTDGDGINDATELIGFIITPITGEPAFQVKTNPNTPFTDSDTFTDGFERLVNLDPTDGKDTDEDGDGLPDPVEEEIGWLVRTVGVSTTPFAQGAVSVTRRYSRTDSVDSDGDGLTDYEEFFLATNASSADTDGDGIDDRTEYLGYALGHKVNDNDLGFIKTDPLDADTDNDKRSDGAEAELVDIELARWVVRVDGEAPRQVFSNPLVADADFDLLVDGDEFSIRTDPNNGNTDGDSRDDGKEFSAGTNPLVEDFQVTVFVTSLTITQDGDGGGNPGDFGFDIGVRRPDSSQPAGLSSFLTSVVREAARLDAPFVGYPTGERNIEPYLPPLDPGETQQSLRDNGPNIYGLNIGDGDTLRLAGLIPQNLRSVSFGMTKNDFFAIEGVIIELDDAASLTYVYLGGLEGVRAQEDAKDETGNSITNTFRPVFYGQDLLDNPDRFRDLTFTFTTDDNFEAAPNSGRIAGSVSMFFIVG